jgi:p-aminobenzoyl-glutamate transporter AbgT
MRWYNAAMKETLQMLCGPFAFICLVMAARYWIGAGIIKNCREMNDSQRKSFVKMIVYLALGFFAGWLTGLVH